MEVATSRLVGNRAPPKRSSRPPLGLSTRWGPRRVGWQAQRSGVRCGIAEVRKRGANPTGSRGCATAGTARAGIRLGVHSDSPRLHRNQQGNSQTQLRDELRRQVDSPHRLRSRRGCGSGERQNCHRPRLAAGVWLPLVHAGYARPVKAANTTRRHPNDNDVLRATVRPNGCKRPLEGIGQGVTQGARAAGIAEPKKPLVS